MTSPLFSLIASLLLVFFPLSLVAQSIVEPILTEDEQNDTTTATTTPNSNQNTENNSSGGIDTGDVVLGIGAGIAIGSLILSGAPNPTTYDFGGKITFISPPPAGCVSGHYPLIIGPPRGGAFLYGPGSISFSAGPPRTLGQSMLGKAAVTPIPCMVPCPAGACPHPAVPSGLLILFHGSSAI